MTTDPFPGEELTDGDLRGEIELVGDLVVAAADADGHLSQEQIDRVLGVGANPVHDDLHADAHARRRRPAAASS